MTLELWIGFVVLEFVLSGCLSGNALSDYGNDLASHYPPPEAFA